MKKIILCPFSGNYHNDYIPTKICSRTKDPYKIGLCETCQISIEWVKGYV